MKVAVPKEVTAGERRVALVPETVEKLAGDGVEVVIESGAGHDYHPDAAYREAGAAVVDGGDELYRDADVVLKVQRPTAEEVDRLPHGAILVSFLDPGSERDLVERLAQRGVTALSIELMPRTGRAQSMDALSAMGSIAGYQSVLLAAEALGRYVPMMTTAAGTTKAAKVMVLGIGVAGLQAIATARRLGAEVEAFDIRPEVKDQVRSLGATFIEAAPEEPEPEHEQQVTERKGAGRVVDGLKALLGVPPEFGGRREEGESREEPGDEKTEDQAQDEEKLRRDQELVAERIAEMDVVLTAAQTPGADPPKLVTEEMVERMKPGAVIVDLAAEDGGNCELTEPGEVVEHHGVQIHGPVNLPSALPIHASHFYSRNMASL
ncbi:MAG TPA: NAD(P) transhydrogenase subunit alpha, partial [Thermoleophilaceae bacterium]|nr:NAD(P) transhydrogenase subunit alpha [Thermoleophilaceae bacterium]